MPAQASTTRYTTRHCERAADPRKCPELSNPVECAHHGRERKHRPDPPSSDLYRGKLTCARAHLLYLYHHSVSGRPRSLRGEWGCRLWRNDATFHAPLSHSGVDDSAQEFLEDFLSDGLNTLLVAS